MPKFNSKDQTIGIKLSTDFTNTTITPYISSNRLSFNPDTKRVTQHTTQLALDLSNNSAPNPILYTQHVEAKTSDAMKTKSIASISATLDRHGVEASASHVSKSGEACINGAIKQDMVRFNFGPIEQTASKPKI